MSRGLCLLFSEHRVLIIMSTAVPGCVCPVIVAKGGDIRLFRKTSLQGFFLERRSLDGFNTLSHIQKFRVEKITRGCGKLKPSFAAITISVILVHSIIVIYVSIDRYHIR